MRTTSKFLVLAVLSYFLCAPAVRPLLAADNNEESLQTKSQRALVEYYSCVKTYALKFTKTSAPASEIAEAALSACADSSKALFLANLAFVGVRETAEHLETRASEAARRWAIQSVLEARFQIK